MADGMSDVLLAGQLSGVKMRAGLRERSPWLPPGTFENIISEGKLDEEIMTTGSAADEHSKRDTKCGVFQRGSKKVHIKCGSSSETKLDESPKPRIFPAILQPNLFRWLGVTADLNRCSHLRVLKRK